VRALDAATCALAPPDPAGSSRGTLVYAGHLARRPPALATTVAAIIASTASGTLIGLPVVFVVALVTLVAGTRPSVQRHIDDERDRRARRDRREARETALEEAGVRGRRLAVLTELVDVVTARDRASAAELERLLDRYAAVAIALERCKQVVDAAGLLSGRVPRCHDRGSALREELAVIEEHVLLIAEQSALSSCDAIAPPATPDEP
jgi:hypothetical protein